MDLSLVPTDDLLAEVEKRYDHMVFMAIANTEISQKSGSIWKWRYSGNVYQCIGLASNMVHRLNARILISETYHDGKGT